MTAAHVSWKGFWQLGYAPPPLLLCEWIERKSFTFLIDKSCRTRPWTVPGMFQDCLSNLCKCWAPLVQQQTKIAHQHFVTSQTAAALKRRERADTLGDWFDVCSAKQISIGWRLCVHRGEKKKEMKGLCVENAQDPISFENFIFFLHE